ncbi:hypothetical protein [Echinimonas agarilytica]|uniref:Lipoprotein n=1 Tax=Echinimonas agarilytica TaxID=1215918 RepID=A0AA41W8X7_9GAMM|nr:hypothetical protein [Echinimonas agarilytica]MCM2680294.1 hypothetical protein [Echinimonas agarilytica]
MNLFKRALWITAALLLSSCSLSDLYLFDDESEGTAGFTLAGIYDDQTPITEDNGIAPNGAQVSTCDETRLQNFLRRSTAESLAPNNPALGSIYVDLGSLKARCTHQDLNSYYIVDLISPDLTGNSKWSSIDKVNFKYASELSSHGSVLFELVVIYNNGTVTYSPQPPTRLSYSVPPHWNQYSVDLDPSNGPIDEIRFRFFYTVNKAVPLVGDNHNSSLGIYIDAISAHKSI